MKNIISFIAVLLISYGVFAQVKSGHGGMGSGGPNQYAHVMEMDRVFVEAFNGCIKSKIKYISFKEIYLSIKVAELSSRLNKIGKDHNTLNCNSSGCILAPEVKKHLQEMLISPGFDEYLGFYYSLEATEVKKDIKEWLGP